jgi:hypothetical protein
MIFLGKPKIARFRQRDISQRSEYIRQRGRWSRRGVLRGMSLGQQTFDLCRLVGLAGRHDGIEWHAIAGGDTNPRRLFAFPAAASPD